MEVFCFFLGVGTDVVISHFGNGKRFCLPTSIKMNSAYLRAQRGCHKLTSDVSLILLQARFLKERLWNVIPLSQERLKSTYSEQASMCLCLTRCPLVFPWILLAAGGVKNASVPQKKKKILEDRQFSNHKNFYEWKSRKRNYSLFSISKSEWTNVCCDVGRETSLIRCLRWVMTEE